MLQTEIVVSDRRAAVLDLHSGIGVAVELDPPCDCAPCLLAWWEDRTSWEADLAVLSMVPVDQLPDEPGVLTRYLIGTCVPHDDDGERLALWGPDVLPVHERGAEAVHGQPLLPELWERLGEVVAALDAEVGRAAWRG